ncbi:MAG: hypothetical protein M3N41_03465 [Acidobacteriota bacterium]|nr:hypothetical protein [Acidobacteriota bacterium]
MRSISLLLLSSAVALAGSGGGPAVYVVGNLDGVSAGAEGILVLEKEQAVFRSGKVVFPLPYADIHNVELGTKVVPPSAPLYKVWQLHKRLLVERPEQRMLNFEFTDKDGKDQSMTLEFGESAANETLAEIEIHQGKRLAPKRATNGDPWWGDSVWKTSGNNNTVSPEDLGNTPAK